MNNFRYWIIITLIMLVPQVSAFNGAASDQILALNWQSYAGDHFLKNGTAIITTSSEEWLIEGSDAHRFIYLAEGYEAIKPDAVTVRVEGSNQGTAIIYTFNEIGYIKTDDWEKVDNNAILREIKRSTKAANKIKEPGYPSLFVDGWIQEPYLDKKNAIVYWAISIHDSKGNQVVNAKALKLGREGFTEIIWTGKANQFSNAEEVLSSTIGAHKYFDGLTYADYVPGTDTLAAVGVGALTYRIITGKGVAKAGGKWFAALAIFVKKVWLFILVALAFVWKYIKNLFVGQKAINHDSEGY